MAFEEILGLVEGELHNRRLLLEGKGELLKTRENQLSQLQEENQQLRDRIWELKAGPQDGGINWRRRYEKLTGRHGRTVDELRRTITAQGEEIQRLQADLHRYAKEIASRAETHGRVREENAVMLMELMDLRRKLAKLTGEGAQGHDGDGDGKEAGQDAV